MNRSAISVAVAALCVLPLAAQGASTATSSAQAPGARTVAMHVALLNTTPDAPAAAFVRLLTPRSPTPSAATVPPAVDPLLQPLRSALWTAPASAPIGITAGLRQQVRP